MEELVIFILQIVVEVGIQIFGSLGVDFASGWLRDEKGEDGCGWLILFAVFGAILGGISLLIFPKVLLTTVGLRVANLILAPILAGGLSAAAAEVGIVKGKWTIHFWRGFWFALPFGLMRFLFGER